jgi:hypothetical protein
VLEAEGAYDPDGICTQAQNRFATTMELVGGAAPTAFLLALELAHAHASLEVNRHVPVFLKVPK